MALRAHGEQVVHGDALVRHDEVAGHKDAEQWSDQSAQQVERVMDGLVVRIPVPRGDDHRADRGDHAAGAPADLLRVDVGEVERGGDEVGHDVDADGRGDEGDAAQQNRERGIDALHGFDRVGDQLAEHRHGRGGADDGKQGEHHVIHWESPEIALLDILVGVAVSGEVAEIQHRAGEVRHDERDGGDHHRNGLRETEGLAVGEVQIDGAEAACADHQIDGEDEHHRVHQRPGEVGELADGVHALPEHARLGHPQDAVGDPTERGESEERVVLGERLRTWEELQEDDVERFGGEEGLHAVPCHGDDAADDGRDVRAFDAEHEAHGDGEGHARALAGLGHEIDERLHDDDADDERDEHLPAGDAEREQASGGHIAADGMHVGHPEREDVVPRPGLLLQRGEVLVGQTRVVAGLDGGLRILMPVFLRCLCCGKGLCEALVDDCRRHHSLPGIVFVLCLKPSHMELRC